MAGEIIFKCNSKNNKNVREGELKILRKKENELYFEFGENEINLKKRFYDDLKTLNEDFNELLKLQKKEENYSVKLEKDEEDKSRRNSTTKKEDVF